MRTLILFLTFGAVVALTPPQRMLSPAKTQMTPVAAVAPVATSSRALAPRLPHSSSASHAFSLSKCTLPAMTMRMVLTALSWT